jgi:stage V sporulation protein G
MPSRRTKNGEYKDVAHPINTGFRTLLQDRILEEYNGMAPGEMTNTEDS